METSMIRVENLVKKFGDLAAVNDVSFDVKKGEIFAFLGPNGAGKTTLLKMIAGASAPDAGEVRLGASLSRSFEVKAVALSGYQTGR